MKRTIVNRRGTGGQDGNYIGSEMLCFGILEDSFDVTWDLGFSACTEGRSECFIKIFLVYNPFFPCYHLVECFSIFHGRRCVMLRESATNVTELRFQGWVGELPLHSIVEGISGG